MELILGIVFIVVGLLIKYGKMYFLIAGLNTMNHKQRAEYNLEKIGTLFRNVLCSMGVFIIIGSLLASRYDYSHMDWVLTLIAVLVGTPILLFKSNSDKYRSWYKE